MATSVNCWKCLSRPSTSSFQLSSAIARVSSVPFSSTATNLANPIAAKKSTGLQKGQGLKQTLRIKKKAQPKSTGKPPAAGERKAMRKRIVLSNTNALEVTGMQDLSREMVDGILKEKVEDGMTARLVGKVVGLPGPVVDSLRAVEAFKTTQGWGLFRRPGLLVRNEAIDLTKSLVWNSEIGKETLRIVLDGARGTGKSMMILHAQATAFARGWIVLNIPEAQEVTNAVNDYALIPGAGPALWAQPTYTANWLTCIEKANGAILRKLKLTKNHNLPFPVAPDTDLSRLCELGARDSDFAWPVFQAIWAELNVEGRPPVMLTMDSMNFAMKMSEYRNPTNEKIHSFDLAIVKHFTDYISGAAKLTNGGAVIAATSKSHAPISISMNLAIRQSVDEAEGREITKRDPFESKYDERVDKALKNINVITLTGLSKHEARGLMEYWAASGVLRQRVDEQSVTEKWTLAGNGIVGEIQRGALKMRI